jgi:hypothetical protein
MLLRNMDQVVRLCNGIRLIITRMGKYVVEHIGISSTINIFIWSVIYCYISSHVEKWVADFVGRQIRRLY